MREILFRGKRKDNDEWVEGYYARKGVDKDTFKHFICVMTFNVNGNTYSSMFYLTDIEVIPETVGQYTGMTDKNGTKIFEGDIVKHIQKYEISGEVKSIAVIKWNEAYSCWSVEYTNGRITAFLGTEYHKLEVIGNVHDNPELLQD